MVGGLDGFVAARARTRGRQLYWHLLFAISAPVTRKGRQSIANGSTPTDEGS